jgi:5-(carboxyamino)imidazole ribonucleotide mutase
MPSVTFLLGSKVDVDFAQKIADMLKEYGVDSEIIVASAHKVPELVVKHIDRLNARKEPTVVITCVGMSNGLAGVAAASLVHPLVNCPPFKDLNDYLVNVHSSLQMPSDVPVMTVLNPKNAALCALKILGGSDPKIREKVAARIAKVKAEY